MSFAVSVPIRRKTRLLGLLAALAITVIGPRCSLQPAEAQQVSGKAWLGVELDRGPAGGVIAKHVIRSSPAMRAGLLDGDQIVEAEGVAIDEPKQIIARVAIVGPGGTLKLKIRRGGVERDLEAMLAPHPGAAQVLRLDKIGTFAPTWKNVQVVSGSLPSNLGQMRGKVVLLDFWASWCGPCRMIAPELSKLQASYGAKGLVVVGMTGDSLPVAARAAEALSMRYAVASDPSETTASQYGVGAIPTMFVIDKKGVIRDVFVGFNPTGFEDVEKLVNTLIAEPAPPETRDPQR